MEGDSKFDFKEDLDGVLFYFLELVTEVARLVHACVPILKIFIL